MEKININKSEDKPSAGNSYSTMSDCEGCCSGPDMFDIALILLCLIAAGLMAVLIVVTFINVSAALTNTTGSNFSVAHSVQPVTTTETITGTDCGSFGINAPYYISTNSGRMYETNSKDNRELAE